MSMSELYYLFAPPLTKELQSAQHAYNMCTCAQP